MALGLILLINSPVSVAVIEVDGRDSKSSQLSIQKAIAGDTVQLPGGMIGLTEALVPKSDKSGCAERAEKTIKVVADIEGKATAKSK